MEPAQQTAGRAYTTRPLTHFRGIPHGPARISHGPARGAPPIRLDPPHPHRSTPKASSRAARSVRRLGAHCRLAPTPLAPRDAGRVARGRALAGRDGAPLSCQGGEARDAALSLGSLAPSPRRGARRAARDTRGRARAPTSALRRLPRGPRGWVLRGRRPQAARATARLGPRRRERKIDHNSNTLFSGPQRREARRKIDHMSNTLFSGLGAAPDPSIPSARFGTSEQNPGVLRQYEIASTAWMMAWSSPFSLM